MIILEKKDNSVDIEVVIFRKVFKRFGKDFWKEDGKDFLEDMKYCFPIGIDTNKT